MKKNITYILVFVLSMSFMATNTREFEISKNLEIFISIVDELNNNYVDDIKPGQIIRKGIDAMLKSLDPYTVYYSESEVEDYQIQITGKYGGIGALINKDSNYTYISEPYEGFPAHQSGLWAGDKILEINGKEMKGKTTGDVSKLLKGSPNTDLEVVIQRPYENDTKLIKITRKEIKLKSVPYYGLIDSNIAFIKLTKFTRGCGNDVKKALQSLSDSIDLKGCVLDLRGNSGGLLLEAVNVSNVFIPKGQVIVSTKGKKLEKDYKTLNEPVDTVLPLAVLTNKGSASASEIVSGSIQDLDRGVLIGQNTYGKGLVQNTRPVGYNTQIKLTTAKYYIPSGRCIQKIDYSNKNTDGESSAIHDSLIQVFKTNNGREVFDGKGIKPDINTEKRKYSQILRTLMRNRLIFDYATYYRSKNDSAIYFGDFELNDSIYADFVQFIKDKDYKYETNTEKIFEELTDNTKEEQYYEAMEESLNELKNKLTKDKANDIQKFRVQISHFLKEEISSRYEYQVGRIKTQLEDDPELEKAISLIRNPEDYNSILTTSNEE